MKNLIIIFTMTMTYVLVILLLGVLAVTPLAITFTALRGD